MRALLLYEAKIKFVLPIVLLQMCCSIVLCYLFGCKYHNLSGFASCVCKSANIDLFCACKVNAFLADVNIVALAEATRGVKIADTIYWNLWPLCVLSFFITEVFLWYGYACTNKYKNFFNKAVTFQEKTLLKYFHYLKMYWL